jgi:hypothetical protein
MIPFLVADRPISLSIIKGIALPPGAKVGVMGQATTTSLHFRELFRGYPQSVNAIYQNGQPSNKIILTQTIRMVDSGIFGKDGCNLSYDELFSMYEYMTADYGIIIDVLRDVSTTLESARLARRKYQEKQYSFSLVGVAQGTNVSEYMKCYEKLIKLGYQHIAIGGLLQKRQNTARYVYVRSHDLMEEVLKEIRKNFDPKWLFALGVFHPKRIDLFQECGVWGSDYKGWLFNYEKKGNVINLIRSKKIDGHSRIGIPDLKLQEVRRLSEQELRFKLTRGFIEHQVLNKIAK